MDDINKLTLSQSHLPPCNSNTKKIYFLKKKDSHLKIIVMKLHVSSSSHTIKMATTGGMVTLPNLNMNMNFSSSAYCYRDPKLSSSSLPLVWLLEIVYYMHLLMESYKPLFMDFCLVCCMNRLQQLSLYYRIGTWSVAQNHLQLLLLPVKAAPSFIHHTCNLTLLCIVLMFPLVKFELFSV